MSRRKKKQPVPSKPGLTREEWESLMSAAKAGSQAALGELLVRERWLDGEARKALDTDMRAKMDDLDLMQDTFVAALVALPDFRGTSLAEWTSWLRAIVRRLGKDAHRKYHASPKRALARETPLTQAIKKR